MLLCLEVGKTHGAILRKSSLVKCKIKLKKASTEFTFPVNEIIHGTASCLFLPGAGIQFRRRACQWSKNEFPECSRAVFSAPLCCGTFHPVYHTSGVVGFVWIRANVRPDTPQSLDVQFQIALIVWNSRRSIGTRVDQ